MRKCPVCEIELQETKYHKEIIDRCEQCGGAYFDHGELGSIINLVSVFKNITLHESEIDTISDTEKNRELRCPADNELMQKQEIAGEIVDICKQCKGIWLDKGEIIALKIAENHVKENMNLYIRLGN